SIPDESITAGLARNTKWSPARDVAGDSKVSQRRGSLALCESVIGQQTNPAEPAQMRRPPGSFKHLRVLPAASELQPTNTPMNRQAAPALSECRRKQPRHTRKYERRACVGPSSREAPHYRLWQFPQQTCPHQRTGSLRFAWYFLSAH